ncbi:MAG: 3-oxoacyl-[acyl-carrier protein] reductase paralog, partial [uncultured Nocardioides sp.]
DAPPHPAGADCARCHRPSAVPLPPRRDLRHRPRGRGAVRLPRPGAPRRPGSPAGGAPRLRGDPPGRCGVRRARRRPRGPLGRLPRGRGPSRGSAGRHRRGGRGVRAARRQRAGVDRRRSRHGAGRGQLRRPPGRRHPARGACPRAGTRRRGRALQRGRRAAAEVELRVRRHEGGHGRVLHRPRRGAARARRPRARGPPGLRPLEDDRWPRARAARDRPGTCRGRGPGSGRRPPRAGVGPGRDAGRHGRPAPPATTGVPAPADL